MPPHLIMLYMYINIHKYTTTYVCISSQAKSHRNSVCADHVPLLRAARKVCLVRQSAGADIRPLLPPRHLRTTHRGGVKRHTRMARKRRHSPPPSPPPHPPLPRPHPQRKFSENSPKVRKTKAPSSLVYMYICMICIYGSPSRLSDRTSLSLQKCAPYILVYTSMRNNPVN